MLNRPGPAQTPAEAAVAKFDLGDEELAMAAKKAAKHVEHVVGQLHGSGLAPQAQLRCLWRLARRHRVEPPAKEALHPTVNRMTDPAWWRRALRKRFRIVEHEAIAAGRVHARASPYVSDAAARRGARNRRRIAELLASLEAVNQSTGEVIPLEELAAQSLANPAMRRKALAARIKGIEQHADSKALDKLFLTITCPSRFHARHRASGSANERYDRRTVRQAQAHLSRTWGNAIRRLAHDGIKPHGLRVVEPHHDGCPHWHVLLFVDPRHSDQLIRTVSAYAMREAPDEPGAAEHRFTFKRLDAAGGALGYVLKYISKSIDGEGVDKDRLTDLTGADASVRVVEWARGWGIRQFQFFGVPAITPTRELYRVNRDALPSQALQAAHDATKANDYAAWLRVSEAHELRFSVDYTERDSARYAGELSRRIFGLTASACDLARSVHLTTRTDEWRVQFRREAGEAVPPWTRFNKSAPPVESTSCGRSTKRAPRANEQTGNVRPCLARAAPRGGSPPGLKAAELGARSPC